MTAAISTTCVGCGAVWDRHPSRVSEYCADCSSVRGGEIRGSVMASADGRWLRRRTLAEIEAVHPQFLWRGWLVAGHLNVVFGDGGLGKSTLLVWIASQVTRGELVGAWFGQPRHVWWFSQEEDVGFVKLRCQVAGADVSMIDVFEWPDGSDSIVFPRDIDTVLAQVGGEPPALVVFDSLDDHLDVSLSSRDNKDTRAALRPLVVLAERSGAAVVGIHHASKSKEYLGSVAYRNLTRSMLHFGKVDPTSDRLYLTSEKGNFQGPATALEFAIESVPVEDRDGRVESVGRMRFVDTADVTSADLKSIGRPERTESALEIAQSFLIEHLIDGVLPSVDLFDIADERGIAERTLNRAKKSLGVTSERMDGYWVWRLPDGFKFAKDAMND